MKKAISMRIILSIFALSSILWFYSCSNAFGSYSNPLDQKSENYAGSPTITSIIEESGQAIITWTAVTGATSYNIYYSEYAFKTKNGASPFQGTICWIFKV